jgi:hypothetical protein
MITIAEERGKAADDWSYLSLPTPPIAADASHGEEIFWPDAEDCDILSADPNFGEVKLESQVSALRTLFS